MSLEEGSITVLHVDDEGGFAEMTAEYLERKTDQIRVITETSVSDGLDRLAGTEEIDCVLSDYEMPGQNGIEFLETVREIDPDLPFILYTGKGSEAIASDAIAADVTDYLQKESGTSQYAVLANRIENAVAQYRAEQAVEETEQRYRRLIEESTDVITVVDENGEYKYVSPAAERLLGYTAEELVGENGFEYIHPEDRGPAMEQFGEIVAHPGGMITTEFRFQRPDGGWTWLGIRGRNLLDDQIVNGVVVYASDITARKEREHELERYERIVETIDDVAFVVDEEWTVDYVNETVTQYVNASTDELEGQPVMGLAETYVASEDGPERFEETLERAFDADGSASSLHRLELALDLPGGEVVFEYQFSPLVVDGETTAVVITMRDITERKEREDELEATKEQLERRNERLREFASVVSHDLRSPLNVAEGRLKLARKECDSEQLEAVAGAHQRMQTLMDDLLALARNGETVSDIDTVDLSVLVEECWRNVVTTDARLSIEAERVLRADEGRLKQLVENLLRNAVEHGGDDVTVTIGNLDDGDGFYVADDGTGIPTSERENVLENGYSTTKNGTGFGLGIVNRLAEAHGWDVDVTDSENGGARIEIEGIEAVET
jgi:PAS domain S-box-containing protein